MAVRENQRINFAPLAPALVHSIATPRLTTRCRIGHFPDDCQDENAERTGPLPCSKPQRLAFVRSGQWWGRRQTASGGQERRRRYPSWTQAGPAGDHRTIRAQCARTDEGRNAGPPKGCTHRHDRRHEYCRTALRGRFNRRHRLSNSKPTPNRLAAPDVPGGTPQVEPPAPGTPPEGTAFTGNPNLSRRQPRPPTVTPPETPTTGTGPIAATPPRRIEIEKEDESGRDSPGMNMKRHRTPFRRPDKPMDIGLVVPQYRADDESRRLPPQPLRTNMS